MTALTILDEPRVTTPPAPQAQPGATQPDERAVARGLVNGDSDALEEAFRSWSGMVHAYCTRTVGAQDADDLTQQVFVQAWRSRLTFDPDRGVVPGWLIGIARNLVARHLQARAGADTPVAAVKAGHEPDATDHLADRMVVTAALRTLPEPQQSALRMSFYDGLSQSEIATRLDLPLGTVKSHHRRALIHLKSCLEHAHVDR
jgi:RNA polymerase sigma factor (sigma-70 family)